ncbi:MAG: nickel-type superoxide dismutase maturation protease [Nodosilinea sp.]
MAAGLAKPAAATPESCCLPPRQLRSSRWGDLLLWWLGRRRRLRVVGYSMAPLLMPGEEVLVNPQAYHSRTPQPGDLVVARHPHRPQIRLIKWVVYGVKPQAQAGAGYFLAGLNLEASTDSRSFGLVTQDHLLALVVCRFP